VSYRRTNHDNFHVRGYKEEGTITTPFDMTVLNDLDRFHLVTDAIDRLPRTGDKGIYLKQQLKDKLIEHKQYIDKHALDMHEILDWRRGAGRAADSGREMSPTLPRVCRIRVCALRDGDSALMVTMQCAGRGGRGTT